MKQNNKKSIRWEKQFVNHNSKIQNQKSKRSSHSSLIPRIDLVEYRLEIITQDVLYLIIPIALLMQRNSQIQHLIEVLDIQCFAGTGVETEVR